MTMSPPRSIVFDIARRVLLHLSNVCKAVSGPINVWTSWLLFPIRAFSHASNEYEAPGHFYIRPPFPLTSCLESRDEILVSGGELSQP